MSRYIIRLISYKCLYLMSLKNIKIIKNLGGNYHEKF